MEFILLGLLGWLFLFKIDKGSNVPFNERGGGRTEIQQAPAQPPAPSAGESAESLYQARLQYDPQVAGMEYDLAQQYEPLYAAMQAGLYGQYAPQVAGIQEQVRQQYSPEQYALTEEFAQQARQRLADPYAETAEETAAMEAARGRQREQLTRGLRERAELGGGLYGGRAARREEMAGTELEQAFTTQDIARRQQGAQTALQYAIPMIQQLYPQVGFPGQPAQRGAVQQPVTPGADALYQAMYGAGRQQYFPQQYQGFLSRYIM